MTYEALSPDERERLRAAYEAGFAAGAYCPSLVPEALLELINAVAIDWFARRETTQAAQKQHADAIPEWLLKLPSQDAQPLEGWGAEGWPI